MPEVLLQAGPQGAGEALQGMWLLLTPSGAWNTAVLWLQQDQHSCQPAQQHLPQALWMHRLQRAQLPPFPPCRGQQSGQESEKLPSKQQQLKKQTLLE